MVDPAHWRKIQDLFHAALELPTGERARFLESTCEADAALRQEVESLLRAHEQAGTFLRSEQQSASTEAQVADIWVGKQIGAYLVLERIGYGGMGVVYRAEDVRLRRGAALKFLNLDLQREPQARERFEREARAASALNHPNICTIYGVDEFEGHPYLAMELLRGQTLSRVIAGEPLPIDLAIEYAIAIASALEAAHSGGIVHRDIKPGNVFLTEKGQIKVLDFGLAKQAGTAVGEDETADTLRTVAEPESLTSPGLAVGTVSYMSPEQARGERLDARSDLFSFGAVLYEMVTGKRAFPGKVQALITDGILNRAPASASSINSQVPSSLQQIIDRALEKDRGRRYQSSSSVLADLRTLQQGAKTSSTAKAVVGEEYDEMGERSLNPARIGRWRCLLVESAKQRWLRNRSLNRHTQSVGTTLNRNTRLR